ncbi:MAG: HNH endonuclease [Actinomycetota bacterium]
MNSAEYVFLVAAIWLPSSQGSEASIRARPVHVVTNPIETAQEVVASCTSGLEGFGACLGSALPVGRVLDRIAPDIPALRNRPDCGYLSFSGDTEVLMADGTVLPIAEIVVGDLVLAHDPETGELGPRRVDHVWTHDDLAVDLIVGDHRVTTTEDHPFWDATDQRWEEAQELSIGDQLLGADGDTTTTGGLDWTSARFARVYNLSVAGIPTYFILVDNNAVHVHNCRPSMAGRVHDSGVPFDSEGFPDFSEWMHPDIGEVWIEPSATRPTDRRRANAAAGIDTEPDGYVWHHHQDFGRMQLVQQSVHQPTGHSGGFSRNRVR